MKGRNSYVPSVISVPSNVTGPRYLMAYDPISNTPQWTLERDKALPMERWFADDVAYTLLQSKKAAILRVESEWS